MKIILILPSLGSGGLEKVITNLAWFFSKQEGIQVHLVGLSKGELFYPVPSDIKVLMPPFSIKEMLRPIFLLNLILWLRKHVKKTQPDALLSFGGKFNAFVLLAVYGLPLRTYISDRSRPSISYGRFLDWLNPRVYKKATGIIAQTEKAKEVMYKRIAHPNIKVIGNPLRISNDAKILKKERIILNVGRFISSKQQTLLVEYFSKICTEGWILCLIGEGPVLVDVKRKVRELDLENRVVFPGNVTNIEDYYNKSEIFAFSSLSEGFPNALGEAMVAGLACISFDCEAGPADLIDEGENGFLVAENDHDDYIRKLRVLIENESLREDFGRKAREKVKRYNLDHIGNQFLEFMKEG